MSTEHQMSFAKWLSHNGTETSADTKVWIRRLEAAQVDEFVQHLGDYGYSGAESEAIRSIVIKFLLEAHNDGRTLGERHGWAVRYAQYILNGGQPHNDEF